MGNISYFSPRSPTSENLTQIHPIIQTKTTLPNEENNILDFEIIPHHKSLSLNAISLHKIARYNLYFNDLHILNFSKVYFDFGTDILDNRYEMRTIGTLIFKNCTFDKTNIHLCTFKNIQFSNCHFKKDFSFQDCIFEDISFYNCTFESRLFLRHCIFQQSYFLNSIFIQHADFSYSAFGEPSTTTNSTHFDKCIFQEGVSFARSKFYGEITSFYGVKFGRTPSFSQAIFQSNLNLINTSLGFDYEDTLQTISSQAKEKKSPIASVANDFRDSFRLFKSSLITSHNLLDASHHHRAELYCKEIELDSMRPKLFSKEWIENGNYVFIALPPTTIQIC